MSAALEWRACEAERQAVLQRLYAELARVEADRDAFLARFACPACGALPTAVDDGVDVRLVAENCDRWCPHWHNGLHHSPELIEENAYHARTRRRDPRPDGFVPLMDVLPSVLEMTCPDCGVAPVVYIHPDSERTAVHYPCEPSCPNR